MATTETLADLETWIGERFSDDPSWLRDRRRSMARVYSELDLPRLDKMSLKHRRLTRIPFLDTPETPAAIDAPPRLGAVSGELVMVNGRVEAARLDPTLAERGVIFTTLAEAVQAHPDLVRQYLGTAIDETQQKFWALNGALWQGGAFLYLPPGAAADLPFSVRHYQSRDCLGAFPRTLVVADRSSEGTLIESYEGAPNAERALFSGLLEVVVGDGARFHVGSLQTLPEHVEAFLQRGATVGRDATLTWNIGEFGGALAVGGHWSQLLAPGGSAFSTTVFFGAGEQQQHYTGGAVHQGVHTTSDVVAKGVLKNKAQGIFTGLTDIKRGAKGADGRQKEQTLMLSDDARADAIPSLLIDENDVFAAHSATTGPVDRQALYYMMSRGLSEREATRLYVHGFLAPVVDAIPLETLRSEVWDAVERKIER